MVISEIKTKLEGTTEQINRTDSGIKKIEDEEEEGVKAKVRQRKRILGT